MDSDIFNRAGFASLDDLKSSYWRILFEELEISQDEFLSKESHFRSKEYRWPRDPLHTCTRVWEYPFVFHHIRQWRKKFHRINNPKVVDLGSGVTFFPLVVANLGCQVIPVDVDPIGEIDYPKVIQAIPLKSGNVKFKKGDALSLPFEDGSIDCLYCISMLEHIPQCVKIIDEVVRVLRNGGLFILTFDIDLSGNYELGPDLYHILHKNLKCNFNFLFPEESIHPRQILTSDNSPYPYYPHSIIYLIRSKMRYILLSARNLLPGSPWYDIKRKQYAVYGAALIKRS